MKMRVLVFVISSIFSFAPLAAQIGLGANAGVYFPITEFGKAYNTGYGGEGSFIYRFNPSFEVALVSGISSYNVDEDELISRLKEQLADAELPEGIKKDAEISVEAPLNIYPLVLSIRYLYGKKKFKPYFFFEGGVFFYDVTYKGYIYHKEYPSYSKDLSEQVVKENSTTLALGGGFLSSLTKKLFLNVEAKWSVINNIKLVEADKDEVLRGVDKTVQTISLTAGLNYYF